MGISVGEVVKGKIDKITKFGAFVKLETGEYGLIHISEISEKYVKKVEDFLRVGQEVEAVVIKRNDDGKISLSLKRLNSGDAKQQPQQHQKSNRNESKKDSDFEQKLAKFLRDSRDKLNDLQVRKNRRQAGGKKDNRR